MSTTQHPAAADLQAACKKALTSAAFAKFMGQAVQEALAQAQQEPNGVVLKRAPTASIEFTESADFRSFTAYSADFSREISMQCERPGGTDGYKTGIWYGSERLTDADGNTWARRLGDHVQDDFGMLVPVPEAA